MVFALNLPEQDKDDEKENETRKPSHANTEEDMPCRLFSCVKGVVYSAAGTAVGLRFAATALFGLVTGSG